MAEERFSWNRISKKIIDMYKKIYYKEERNREMPIQDILIFLIYNALTITEMGDVEPFVH